MKSVALSVSQSCQSMNPSPKTFKMQVHCLIQVAYHKQELMYRDFPGGPVVKNPPYNVGYSGLIPGQGTKIPHAVGQLSPCTTTTELCTSTREPECHKLQRTHALEPARHNQREKTRMPQLERSLHTTIKIPCATTKTRRSQK